LKIHVRAGVCREPSGKTIIVRQIRAPENFSVGVKNTRFARSQGGRRGGGAFEHLADDSLIAGSFYRIRRSTEIHDRRQGVLHAAVKVAHQTQRSEWPEKK